MIRLAVFDLDGTIAAYDKPIEEDDVTLLKHLEETGVQIALCSGKPLHYLCGFLRQIGLKAPIIIGENGSQMQVGIHFPPPFSYTAPYSDEAKQSITFFEKSVKEAIPGIWCQPNQTEFSPFPKTQEQTQIIDAIIQNNRDKIKDICIYRYFDCFDFIPANINKGAALRFLAQEFGFKASEIVSVGNDENDYTMFDFTAHSIGVRLKEKERAKQNVQTFHEALEWIMSAVNNSSSQ